MRSPYAYLLLSLTLFVAWLVLAALRHDIRREMVRVSVGTMFLGLTEPLFVPEYWNPPTLGDLARRTGFDLESLLFSFAIGGIVFAAYHVLFAGELSESVAQERGATRHRYHVLALLSAPIAFIVLLMLTTLNPIYVAAIALVAGFFATLYCRPHLWLKMFVSGVLFLLLYFVVFALFNLAFPGYVGAVWNLAALSRDARRLRACLDELDEGPRKSMILAYYEGLTFAEVAGRLGVPLGTVKSWIRRSLVRLKDCMER